MYTTTTISFSHPHNQHTRRIKQHSYSLIGLIWRRLPELTAPRLYFFSLAQVVPLGARPFSKMHVIPALSLISLDSSPSISLKIRNNFSHLL